jgi:hypothetical protein
MSLYKNKINKALLMIAMLSLALPTALAQAAMQSAHYVIYEDVKHTFSGPVITNIANTVNNTEVTVTWTTDALADSFVVYDTHADFSASKEQGTSLKNYTSHSVVLTGLDPATIYYYKVRSTRINSGVSTGIPVPSSFTTGGTAPVVTPTPVPVAPSPGGGMLIIDKTDKKPPVITNVKVNVASSTFVEITWTTDEKATSFVEYGESEKYGATYGVWNSTVDHKVILENLWPATTYHFRALSSDGWGNVGYSSDGTFTTRSETGQIVQPTKPAEIDQKVLAAVTQRILDFIRRLFPTISLNKLGANPFASITDINQLANFIPAPVLSGQPEITPGATDATIKWTTDINANSTVAMAPEDKYNANAAEPYIQIVGNPDVYSKDHEVKLIGLAPNTLYHVQLRSKAQMGPTAVSKDFTFRTRLEEMEITSYFTQVIDQQTVIFKWVTNKEADSAVKYTPYFNNQLVVEQTKTMKDNVKSVIHEIKVTDLAGGTTYEVELLSADDKGNMVSKILPNFSTGEDRVPPEITKIKAESTIFIDNPNKTQTVISWTTNEPANSRIYYQEGVHGGDTQLAESTVPDTNYNKDHLIVITKFKPGTVYTFKAESTDPANNMTLSSPHTFMTAKQKESIIQVIMRVLENTFGWMKKIGS